MQYAKRAGVSALLAEYAMRVLRERPLDPVSFLVAEIAANPFTPEPQRDGAFWRDASTDAPAVRAVILHGGPPRFFSLASDRCRRRVEQACADAPTALASNPSSSKHVSRERERETTTTTTRDEEANADLV